MKKKSYFRAYSPQEVCDELNEMSVTGKKKVPVLAWSSCGEIVVIYYED